MANTKTNLAAVFAAGALMCVGGEKLSNNQKNRYLAENEKIARCAGQIGKFSLGSSIWKRGGCAEKEDGTQGELERRFQLSHMATIYTFTQVEASADRRTAVGVKAKTAVDLRAQFESFSHSPQSIDAFDERAETFTKIAGGFGIMGIAMALGGMVQGRRKEETPQLLPDFR